MPTPDSTVLLEAQRDLALGLSAAGSIDEMLRACVHAAMTMSSAECGAAYRLLVPGGQLELVHAHGMSDEFIRRATSFPVGSPVHASIVAQVPFLTGLPKDPERRACCLAEGLQVVAVFAVVHEGRVFGTIHLASRVFDQFEPYVLQAIESIVAHAAGAVARVEAELSARHRARYAEAIASCAAHLVEATDRAPALRHVLRTLLQATHVSRVYVFENIDDDALGLCMSQIAEATAPEIASQLDNPELRRLPYTVAAPGLLAPLSSGEVFRAVVRQLDAPERAILEHQGIRSILVAPIQVQRRFWGFIGLDDCETERVWAEDDVRAMRTVASMVGSFLSRTLAEEAVRESEARYRAIVEGFDGLIYVCSPDFRVEFANARVQQRAKGPPVGKTCYSVLHGKTEKCDWCVNQRVFQGETVRFEVQSPLDGRWYYCVNTPIHHTDGSVSKQSMILDITEQKLAEQARREFDAKLAETQKLESLGVLAGGIAHDFNNLLVAILGNAELALLHLGPVSAARTQLDNIRVAAQRAAELTSQMLACAGKGRFVVQPLCLNEIVAEMAVLLKLSVPKDASLVCDLAPGLPLVDGDASQLRQVAMNLLKNACDAMTGRHGDIQMRTGLAQGLSHGSGEFVYLEVSDTGVGMDEATRARIFEPFFTTKFTGRGLGLAAVQGIVRAHSGTIDVRSVPGEGSTFRVALPVSSIRQPGCGDLVVG